MRICIEVMYSCSERKSLLRKIERTFGKLTQKPSAFGVAALCLLLLFLLLAAQLVHLHPTSTDADRCPVCVMLHSAVPVLGSAITMLLFALGASTPLRESAVLVRRPHARLFCRPPPSSFCR